MKFRETKQQAVLDKIMVETGDDPHTMEAEAPRLPAEPLKEGLGLALDLGTAVVKAYLYDLKKGTCLAAAVTRNAQHVFGADVFSRIRYAENDRRLLQETAVLREQVFDLIGELCRKAEMARLARKAETAEKSGSSSWTEAEPQKPYSYADIHYVTIAGNTAMQLIFAAVSPGSLGTPPFKPLTLFGEQILAEPIMYYCPCISGSVGGDVTAGILSTGIFESEELCLLADLGTEVKFALGNKEGFSCCSLPAEEALEKNKEEQNLLISASCVRKTMETLLQKASAKPEDIRRILLTGGFRVRPDPEALICDGILPEKFTGKMETVRYAAGKGACLALAQENRLCLKKIAELAAWRLT